MTPIKNSDGTWSVVTNGTALVTLPTNEDAWRWIDQRANEHWSPVAHRHHWSFMESAKRG
jgi:hypothetical protein